MVLLRQNRESKLSPTLEPEPCRVVEKNGSIVIIKNATVQSKMWNVGHKKKFIEPPQLLQFPVSKWMKDFVCYVPMLSLRTL